MYITYDLGDEDKTPILEHTLASRKKNYLLWDNVT